MAEQLVVRTFRYQSGQPARQVVVQAVVAGTDTVVETARTDDFGQVALTLAPGSYELLALGTRTALVIEASPTTGTEDHPAFRVATPAATWTWIHGLGRKPPVNLLLDELPDQAVLTDVFYPDLNTLVVEWDRPMAGFITT